MWTKLRAANSSKDKEQRRIAQKSLDFNEEYLSALRTKSCADFFSKAKKFASDQPSSPSYCQEKFSETLLEPDQETISIILDSTILSKVPELKGLLLNYFDISAEASSFCGQLLKNINHIQNEYHFIQRALDAIDDHSPEKVKQTISELNSFVFSSNPLSNLNKIDFKLIHDKYSSVLQHLKKNKKKVVRKLKVIKFVHNATGVCITAACSLVAITAVALAAHTLTPLLMGPMAFSHPTMSLRRKLFKFRFLRSEFLTKVREQLDMAAKGTYILNRDFDTMSRLVARLHDEVEHTKAMIQFCLDRREDKCSLHVMKELKKNISARFQSQVEELEEHVYLCLVTINRARALVIKEMLTTSCVEELR